MAKSLKVTQHQASDLSAISRIDADKLDAVFDCLESQRTPVIAASELRSLIDDCIGIEKQSKPLARQLIALAAYARSSNTTPDVVIERLVAGIRKSDLKPDEKQSLEDSADTLTKLVGQDSVVVSSKALSLGFDYANIYQSSNIVTDIRPVFDERRDSIVGAVIAQTLRIQYSCENQRVDLSLALDKDDVIELKRACEDAIKKAEKSRDLALSKMDVKAFIAGEDVYGYG